MSAPVNPQIIGEHIRRLRSDRGLCVRAFAARTGFSPSFISQLETRRKS
jgi:transcriptional regulator with XRE-family HTH domain